MNIFAPVSTIMNRDIFVVSHDDNASLVKNIFERNHIPHLLVMREGNVVGVISEPDFRHFLSCVMKRYNNRTLSKSMLNIYKLEEIMNTEFSTLEPSDTISVALELLNDNIFTALPVIDTGVFVGFISTHHIVKTLIKGKVIEMKRYQTA